MQFSHLLGAGAALAALGWILTVPPAAIPTTPPMPPVPAVANGHYVLVVEGDRDQLAITHAVAKTDPWAGIPTGFTSDYSLAIRNGGGDLLAEVPVDVSQFAVDATQKGQPLQVEGCIVRDSHINLLVNVPRFVGAASYTFVRGTDQAGKVTLGTTFANQIRDLAGEGR